MKRTQLLIGGNQSHSMYTSFFKLTREPFDMAPNAAFVYMTSTHREALAGLRYAILARKSFTLLTGDAGTGKTTLIAMLLASLPPHVKVFSILHPVLQPDEFLEYLMLQMHIKNIPASKAQRLMVLQDWLQEADRKGEIPVLIIDEAQRLRMDVLEEIRLLGNFGAANKKGIHMIMAGQSELCGLLNMMDLRQLKQRIAVRLSIQPLSPSQVSEYIAYRWQMSGACNEPPFSPEALAVIARYAKGIPRIVNAICDNALVLMMADGKPIIDEAMIVAVCTDLDLVHAAAVQLVSDSPVPVVLPAEAHNPVSDTPFQTLQRHEPSTKPSLLMRCASKFGFVH